MKSFFEMLNILENKKISYSAVLLDEPSREKLLRAIEDKIPKDWKVLAHHMTINLGSK